MKWFFALNESSLNSQPDYWRSLIDVAVRTARERTSLVPHLIFDGEPDEYIRGLERSGVTLVRHRVSFYEELASYGAGRQGYLSISSGAFLRSELCLIERGDDLVLYTDCDVMFGREVDGIDLGHYPFGCGPEFDKSNYASFNTGVMAMNLPRLRDDYAEFRNFIVNNLSLCQTFDQDAYRIFYSDRLSQLPTQLNWKPYWGRSDEAVVVHFHGPKPLYAQRLLDDPASTEAPELREIFNWSLEGYRYYVPRWIEIARACGHVA